MRYTKNQIEIGDFILSRMVQLENHANYNSILRELHDKYGYNSLDPDYMLMSLEEDLGYIRRWGQALVVITADGMKAKKRTLKWDLRFRAFFEKSLSWGQILGYIVGIAGGLYGLLK